MFVPHNPTLGRALSNADALSSVRKGNPSPQTPSTLSKDELNQPPAHSSGPQHIHALLVSLLLQHPGASGPQGNTVPEHYTGTSPCVTFIVGALCLTLIFYFYWNEFHKHKNLRAFVPDINYFLQQLPTSFSKLYLRQGSLTNPADSVGRNSQQRVLVRKLPSQKSRGHPVPDGWVLEVFSVSGMGQSWTGAGATSGWDLQARARSLDLAVGSYRGLWAEDGMTGFALGHSAPRL